MNPEKLTETEKKFSDHLYEIDKKNLTKELDIEKLLADLKKIHQRIEKGELKGYSIQKPTRIEKLKIILRDSEDWVFLVLSWIWFVSLLFIIHKLFF